MGYHGHRSMWRRCCWGRSSTKTKYAKYTTTTNTSASPSPTAMQKKEMRGAQQSAILRRLLYQKQQKRDKFKRRAAIEPIIGHLKSDHRLSRNYYKGIFGDNINIMLAAAAFNFKRMYNKYKKALFGFFFNWFKNILWGCKEFLEEKKVFQNQENKRSYNR